MHIPIQIKKCMVEGMSHGHSIIYKKKFLHLGMIGKMIHDVVNT